MHSIEIQARRAVSGGRVSLVVYRGEPLFYLVRSRDRKRTYIVYPEGYCSCPDYLFSVFLRREREACYHLLAVKIAIKEKRYRTIKVESEEEWRRLYKDVISGFL